MSQPIFGAPAPLADVVQSRFRDTTSIPFELFVGALTLLPFLVLTVLYSSLPEQIPEYLNLRGDVEVWGPKSVFAVFRLPLMAMDLQILIVLMKYRVRKSQHTEESFRLASGLSDWFRATVAVKLCVSSVEVFFLTDDQYQLLARTSRFIAWTASVLGTGAACWYGYRLFCLKRHPPTADAQNQLSALSPVRAHRWVYLFLACLLVLPLLMFWPMLR